MQINIAGIQRQNNQFAEEIASLWSMVNSHTSELALYGISDYQKARPNPLHSFCLSSFNVPMVDCCSTKGHTFHVIVQTLKVWENVCGKAVAVKR